MTTSEVYPFRGFEKAYLLIPLSRGHVIGRSEQKEGKLLPMMSNEGYQDRILTCRDCGQDFTFSAGEQEFYASRGLTNAPGRCPTCRAARRSGQSAAPRQRNSEHFETICATCGRPTSIPFVPREDRPVYCSDCFQAQRAVRTPRYEDSRSYGSGGGGGQGSQGGQSNQGGRGRRDRRDSRDNRDRW